MKTLFITATIALFMGEQNVNAIKLNQNVQFIDDVARAIALAEEQDLMEENPQAFGQAGCNPCYDSKLGPNPHYPYKAAKTQAVGTTVGVTTDYKPVANDKDVAAAGGAPAKKEALGQIDCNPCYQSNKGKNPHYGYAGPPPKMSGYQPGQDPAGGERPGGAKKEEKKDEKKGLAQIECCADEQDQTACNPCYTSNTGPNTHYDYKGNAGAKPFGSTSPPVEAKDDKKEEKKEGLAQVECCADEQEQADCNPCYKSNDGKNPHYAYAGKPPAGPGYQPGKDPSGGEKMVVPGGDKKAALSQMENEGGVDCNPCYQSNKGKNPHYGYAGPPPKMSGYQPGQDPSGGEKPAGAAKAGDKKDEKKAALSQMECNPCYQSNLGPNTHYNYAGNAKAVPFGKTVDPPKKKAEGDKKAAALAQVEDIPTYDGANLGAYAQVIQDAAEDSSPETPITYSQTMEE